MFQPVAVSGASTASTVSALGPVVVNAAVALGAPSIPLCATQDTLTKYVVAAAFPAVEPSCGAAGLGTGELVIPTPPLVSDWRAQSAILSYSCHLPRNRSFSWRLYASR